MSSNSQSPHPSLPAKPPQPSPFTTKPPSTSSAAFAFKPRNVGTSSSASPSQAWQQGSPAPSPQFPPPYGQYGGAQPQHNQQRGAHNHDSSSTTPLIKNPFIPVSSSSHESSYGNNRWNNTNGNSTYDPEYEAQVAQWQATYGAKHDDESKAKSGNANFTSLGSRNAGTTVDATPKPAETPSESGKTVVRSGGGTTWHDDSLLEWDPSHYRLFVGNLAGEVTDDSMMKAFSRYPSVQKARVIRDKRTTKSKGYGFVSFSDGDDYFKAAREMQGKYIGSHPVILRKANSEVKPVVLSDKRKGGKGGNSGKPSGGRASSTQGGNTDRANTGAGISKKPQKTKDGLRILG